MPSSGAPRRGGRPRLLAAVALALATLAAGAALWQWNLRRASEALRRSLEAEFARALDLAREESGVPGLSAAFVLPDGNEGSATAGFADTERGWPMTPVTRFVAGSVGKSLHAALALALDRDGTLDLDAPIARWVGEEPWFPRLPNGPDLTLRLLLQHRSGLVDHLKTPEFWLRSLFERARDDADALLAPVEILEPALDRRPRFAAGDGFAYGDTNYVLAGIVVERAAGASPFDLVEERFLAPLGLDEIVPARSRRIPGIAAGYQLPINPFLLPPKIAEAGELRVHPMNESTAGGFVTTPRALVRWARALFEERALPNPYLDDLVGRPTPTGDGRRYGLGVYVYDTPLGTAWGHGGYFPGYRSALRYFPELRVAVCVQTNRDHLVDVDAILLDLARRVAEAIRRPGHDPRPA